VPILKGGNVIRQLAVAAMILTAMAVSANARNGNGRVSSAEHGIGEQDRQSASGNALSDHKPKKPARRVSRPAAAAGTPPTDAATGDKR
jgi:hypothetical protein